MPDIISVSELTRCVREVLEGEFPLVWVRGQAGTVSRPGSGHIYFTLKDDGASLNVVWFRSNQAGRHSCRPEELCVGQDLVVAGRLSVYPARGSYQLVAELVQDQGVGRLHLQFEALKSKLSGLGYFDAERKRALPESPLRVGVITAPSGAALRDFLRISADRGLPCTIRIYPSLVQGEGAEDGVACAMEQAHLDEWAEVLVLIRGGGSLEDLWTFNTETVARAVFHSEIPVLAGIGHETDLTIADLTADVRAATPSHAAQLLWPERLSWIQRVDELEMALNRAWNEYADKRWNVLRELERGLTWLSPERHLDRLQERFTRAAAGLASSGERFLNARLREAENLCGRLRSTAPVHKWSGDEQRLRSLRDRFAAQASQFLRERESRLELLASRLESADPLAPLARGYCLVRVEADKTLLRSARQVEPGERLDVRTGQGCVLARVEEAGERTEAASDSEAVSQSGGPSGHEPRHR